MEDLHYDSIGLDGGPTLPQQKALMSLSADFELASWHAQGIETAQRAWNRSALLPQDLASLREPLRRYILTDPVKSTWQHDEDLYNRVLSQALQSRKGSLARPEPVRCRGRTPRRGRTVTSSGPPARPRSQSSGTRCGALPWLEALPVRSATRTTPEAIQTSRLGFRRRTPDHRDRDLDRLAALPPDLQTLTPAPPGVGARSG